MHVSSKGDYINLKAYSYPVNTLFTSIVSVLYNGSESFQMSYTAPDVVDTVGSYERYRLLI